MKKTLLLLFSSLFLSITLSTAQQKGYEWRIGISGGYSNYYGDLSPHRLQGLSNWEAIHHLFYYNPHYVDQISYKISVEKKLSPSIGLMFSYGQYTFAMSDRYIQRDGTLMLDNPNFERALNFQNISRDMGLSFVFNTDNDIILPANSFIAPYITIGGGFLDFEVRGDLLDNQGAMYNYATTARINNRIYETDLTRLRTERPEGYSTSAFYANFGLGIRFRMGPRMELFVQSDFIHAFTDYLDDVSGPYRETYDDGFQRYAARPGTDVGTFPNPQRGDPNSPNDWIIYHGIGLKYNFGAAKKSFRAPRLSTAYPDYTVTSTRTTPRTATTEPIVEEDAVEEPVTSPQRAEQIIMGNSYTYFNNIQIVPDQGVDTLAYRSQLQDWEQKIQSRENLILSSRMQRQELQNRQEEIIRESNLRRQDTLLAATSRDSLLILAQEDRLDIRYRLDSIQRRERELRTEIDSLKNLRDNHRMQSRTYTIPRGLDRILWRQDEMETPIAAQQDTLAASPARPRTETLTPAEQTRPTETTGRAQTQPAQIRETAVVPEERAERAATVSPAAQRAAIAQEQRRIAETRQLEQRIRNLELENQRLQAQQQVTPPAGSRYISPPPTYQSRAVVPPGDRQAAATATTPTPDPNRRVQDRTPRSSPFAGLFRRRSTPPASPETLPEERVELEEMDDETRESMRQFGQAVNLAFLGITLRTEEVQEEIPEVELEEEVEAVVAEEPEEITEAMLLEDSEIKLLKSKVEVFFNVNQTQPAMEEMKKLAPLVDFVKDNEEYKLSLLGYADNTGNVAYNLRLIESRIEEVKNVLIKLYGVPPTQIESEVGGQIVRGARRSAHENDRKVEVRIERR